MSDSFDAIIIGSGPSGSYAAINLAKANKIVLLLEKEKLPRYKTCGGGVIFKNNFLADIEVEKVSEVNCFTAEINDYKSNLSLKTQRKIPLVQMVMRKDFDFSLIQRAKELGANIKDNCEVIRLENKSDFVEVHTNIETFKSKFVIIAAGATNKLIKNLVNPGSYFPSSQTGKNIPALEYEVYTNETDYQRYKKTARFDFGIVPHGYCWVLPKKDHLSIGVLTTKKNKVNLNLAFQEYLNILGIRDYEKIERHGYVIPFFNGNGRIYYERILLIGDAGGLADPITGEGISSAILSGKLSAEALLQADMQPTLVEKIYLKKMNEQILKELRAAKFLSYFIYTSEVIRSLVFRLYGYKLSELIADVITGKKRYTQIVKDPKNYLKLFIKWSLKREVKLRI